MAFKKQLDKGSGELFKFEEEGQQLTGIYLGSDDFAGDFAPTKKHLFKTEEGIKTVIGQSHLINLLQNVAVGSLVRVTFEGKKKGKKGNPMNVYGIEIDDEYVADDSEIAAARSAMDDGDQDDEETPMDEVKTAQVKSSRGQAPSTATKARVDSLLVRK